MRGLRTDASFAAAVAEGEDLSGIEERGGIECVVDAAHEREVRVGKDERHELAFFHADAMLTGERAAQINAMANDFGGRFDGAAELGGIAGIEENDGMQVAVAGVKNVADGEAVFLADFIDVAKGLR